MVAVKNAKLKNLYSGEKCPGPNFFYILLYMNYNYIYVCIFFFLISDTDVLAATLKGHSDAVWSLSYNTSRQHLLSASSDGTVKLWSPTSKTQPLIRSFENDTTTSALPTSVDWVRDDLTHMVAAYSNADCVIYDIETGNPVIKLETTQVWIIWIL